MATKAWIDERGVANFNYDTFNDMFTIKDFTPEDPLYGSGIVGLMTVKLPLVDDAGCPGFVQKLVEVKNLNYEISS